MDRSRPEKSSARLSRVCRSVTSVPEPDLTDRLTAAMQALYAASPDDFMGLRAQAVADARAARDKESASAIAKLRKPSVAAWAVNLTAREAPDLVEELVDLGERMRAAQSRLDTATLTGLRPDRDRLLAAWVEAAVAAVERAGRALSAAAQEEVRGTVIAALADATAAAAVGSGQLTRTLSYSGFGEVDVSEAVGRTTGGSILTVLPGGSGRGSGRRSKAGSADTTDDTDDGNDTDDERATHDAEAEAVAAQAALEQAEQVLVAAEEEVSAARQRAEETRERLAVVERQLAKAREADERALEAVTDAVRLRKQAEAARRTAQEAVDRAQAR
jgi:hypothetical protein